MASRVVIFKNTGEIEIHRVNTIPQATALMSPGEYANWEGDEHWIHKFRNPGTVGELFGHTYEYVPVFAVPKVHRAALLLLGG